MLLLSPLPIPGSLGACSRLPPKATGLYPADESYWRAMTATSPKNVATGTLSASAILISSTGSNGVSPENRRDIAIADTLRTEANDFCVARFSAAAPRTFAATSVLVSTCMWMTVTESVSHAEYINAHRRVGVTRNADH